MIRLLNLTPHSIRILAADGTTEIIVVEPSGEVARVETSRTQTGVVRVVADTKRVDGRQIGWIPVYTTTFGNVVGLPWPREGTIYIVSGIVRQAVSGRTDVMAPGELVRGPDGQPVGCKGLSL